MIKTSKTIITHTKRYMDDRYAKYVERYDKVKAIEAARGYNMLSEKLTRVSFEHAYEIFRDTAFETGRYNKDIVGEIVRDQRFGLKRNKAAQFAQQLKSLGTGKTISVQDAMHMKTTELAAMYDAEYNAKHPSTWILCQPFDT